MFKLLAGAWSKLSDSGVVSAWVKVVACLVHCVLPFACSNELDLHSNYLMARTTLLPISAF